MSEWKNQDFSQLTVLELRKVASSKIMGMAPENIRHFIELRGIGIINVARVFGIGSVRSSVEVEMVVQLEPWDRTKNYDRTGLETEYYDILGVKVPSMLIPVMPGRNLAVILETAAINNRQKEMGYNAAKKAYDSMHLAKYILAAELICDGQALDCYDDKRCAKGTQAIYDLLRTKVPEMDNDMPLTPYLEAVAQQIIDRAYIRTVEASVGELKF